MNEWIFVVKDLILTSPFHTEHNETPEFSRNTSTYATVWLLQHSFLVSLLSLSHSHPLSLCFCVGWWRGNKKQKVFKKLNILMVYWLYISNLSFPTHNVSIVDSQWTHNFFERKTNVKIKSCSCFKFHHTKVSINFGFI